MQRLTRICLLKITVRLYTLCYSPACTSRGTLPSAKHCPSLKQVRLWKRQDNCSSPKHRNTSRVLTDTQITSRGKHSSKIHHQLSRDTNNPLVVTRWKQILILLTWFVLLKTKNPYSDFAVSTWSALYSSYRQRIIWRQRTSHCSHTEGFEPCQAYFPFIPPVLPLPLRKTAKQINKHQ